MKKSLFFCVFLISCLSVFGQELTLDQAINTSIVYLNGRLPQWAKIAVINFGVESYTSLSNMISEYIIDDMVKYFVNNGNFSIVDRQNLDKARNELKFNMSGEVSDESAQSIGRFLGAQVVIFGSIKPLGNIIRFQVRALRVETAEILGIYTVNVQKNDITRVFGTPPKPPKPPLISDEYKEYANRNYLDFVDGYFLWGDDGVVGVGGMMFAGGIHWSPIPFISIGAETAFAGMFDSEYYGTGSLVAGLVFPLKIETEPITSFFFDGILEIGYFGSYTGLIANVLTPSADAGLSFRWYYRYYRDFRYYKVTSMGFDIKYKRTFLRDYAINGINIVYIWQP
jgi:TolB-like protein